ncbi:DUF397 domain-containing protein [Streptomyces umbrinus]|uniref:DUF397 domain-containing protein n=1 Tax=Streptomyces umbrinus TaxID=67370 RepID=UPI003C30D05B
MRSPIRAATKRSRCRSQLAPSTGWRESREAPVDNWRQSSYSGERDGNACVETANSPTQVAVRETKAPARATLTSRPEPSPPS